MKSIALVVAALATAITLTLTSCANWSEQEALIAQLPPGQRAQAELQLARDKQAARMQDSQNSQSAYSGPTEARSGP
jgi:hypothetical protein